MFQGPISKAPATIQALAGSLTPVPAGASIGVIYLQEHERIAEHHSDPIHTDAPHLLIVLGPRASLDASILLEGVEHSIEIILGEEATLSLLCLQKGSAKTVIKQRSKLDAGASLRLQNVTLGSDVDHEYSADVVGHDATSTLDWIFYANNHERQHLSARNIFHGRNGGGEITMKGVAQDTAHVGCEGFIEIGPEGSGTNTYLTEHVLMLDPTAKIDAVPGLEIKTNDVKASHSASVARVTPEDLFYFAARGIPDAAAKQMFVLGFLGDLMQKIPDLLLRNRVYGELEEKYGQAQIG